jgi:hypothetical protein
MINLSNPLFINIKLIWSKNWGSSLSVAKVRYMAVLPPFWQLIPLWRIINLSNPIFINIDSFVPRSGALAYL